jgi:hypothetical protein
VTGVVIALVTGDLVVAAALVLVIVRGWNRTLFTIGRKK